MKRTGTPKDNKYQTPEWQKNQKLALEQRKALIPALSRYGIKESDINSFEILVKAASRHSIVNAGIREIANISGLVHVHYIDSDQVKLSESVVRGLRGTILWHDQAVIRGPIRYTETATKMLPKGDYVEFTGGKIVGKINLKSESLSFRFYNDGTVIDIFKANGVVHYVTAKNLVPKGIRSFSQRIGIGDEGRKWLHSPSRWAPFHVPFMTSFTEIAKAVDPNLLNPDVLFPPETTFSNKVYRFFVSTPERMRADTTVCHPTGFMTYIGCIEEWPLDPVTEEDRQERLDPLHPYNPTRMGQRHEIAYVPKNTVPEIPPLEIARQKPFIVNSPGFDMEWALRMLDRPLYASPDAVKDAGRHRGGGSVLAIGRNRKDQEVAIQVVSPSYEFRSEIMGTDSSNLYNHFMMRLDDALFDPKDDAKLEVFKSRYEILVVPDKVGGKDYLPRLLEKIRNYQEIPVVYPPGGEEQVKALKNPSKLLRKIIWYNFLRAANMMLRDEVFHYMKRRDADIEFVARWLVSKGHRVTQHTMSSQLDKFHGLKKDQMEKDQDKFERIRSRFMQKIEGEKKAEAYAKGLEYKRTALTEREIIRELEELRSSQLLKLINYIRKITNTTLESAQISNPQAVGYYQEHQDEIEFVETQRKAISSHGFRGKFEDADFPLLL
ncbi:Hypothetical protein POVR1_LOCUS52 [uncultured virus]|nr:Hypothetical protein POVR1_LOCUS52 [uncultured virus]